MQLTPMEERVVDELLPTVTGGRRRARTLALALECDEVGAREVVRSLRLKGVVICSDKDGFFLPTHHVQAEKTSRHLWSRVAKIAKVARAFDKARALKFGGEVNRAEQIELVFGEPLEEFAEELARSVA